MAREENRDGFHGKQRINFPKSTSADAAGNSGGPPGGPKTYGKEPTNHAGSTYDPGRRSESDSRINAFRNKHGSKQYGPIVR